MAAAANLFARAGAGSRKLDPFGLGDRAAILHHLDQAALIPRVAETEGRRFPIEVGCLKGEISSRVAAAGVDGAGNTAIWARLLENLVHGSLVAV